MYSLGPMSTFDEEAAAATAVGSPAPMSARSFSQLLDELQQTRDSIARSMAGALEHATSEDSSLKEDEERNPVATFSLSGSSAKRDYLSLRRMLGFLSEIVEISFMN